PANRPRAGMRLSVRGESSARTVGTAGCGPWFPLSLVRHFSIKGARRMHARSMPQDSVELLCAGQLTHLLVQRRERANLARHIGEAIGRLEVFIAAPSPETAIGVDDQRMADTATEYARTIRSGVNLTGPRPSGPHTRHPPLHFTDNLL